MKTLKILSLMLAVLMLAFCFVACDKEEPADTTAPVSNPDEEGKIKVTVNAYVTYEWDEENEEYKTVKSPILLSADGGIAVDPGCGVNDAIKALAALRGATVAISDSGLVDSITNGGDVYKSGDKFLSERFNEDETRQYYDIVVWRWYLNDTLVTDSSSVALKEGDTLELKLEIDTTSTVLYETIG